MGLASLAIRNKHLPLLFVLTIYIVLTSYVEVYSKQWTEARND